MERHEPAPPDAMEVTAERHVFTLEADKPFEVEVAGPPNADEAVIFVHGFGVKRDSRGLFTDIEDNISATKLSVRGDFSDITSEGSRAIPISVQASRLERISEFVQERFAPSSVVYVGHSQGSLVIAEANPTERKIVLLAPPIDSPAERFAATPGWSRPGSILDQNGESRLERSDGSVTQAGADYWEDYRQVDAEAFYRQLGEHNQVEIISAGADQVLGQQSGVDGIATESVEGADHDFSGAARPGLLAAVLGKIG